MDSIRWGLLSTAHINRRVIPAIRASQRGRLVAVASRNLPKAQEYANQWQIPLVFGNYEEMLASSEIDAVYISLPNHLHADWAINALKAGKHVLCEKPFALSVEDATRMLATSRETGCVLTEALMYRHHPQTKMVGEFIRDGKLGQVVFIKGHFSFLMNNREGNVRLLPEYGGGALWDLGVYPLSFSQFIHGRMPVSVSAVQYIGETGVDEIFSAQLDYGGGQSTQFACSFRSSFYTSIEIFGSLGRMIIDWPFTQINDKGCQVKFIPDNGETRIIITPKLDPYQGEVEDLQDAILDGKEPLIRPEETLEQISIIRALHSSARSGQVVSLQ